MKEKTSIRFFNNKKIRSRYDLELNKWYYSSSDIINSLIETNNARKYWNTFKNRHTELKEYVKEIKLTADDGKIYLTDSLDSEGVKLLISLLKVKDSDYFNKWIKGLDNPIDELSRLKAYELYNNGLLDNLEEGKIDSLLKIHFYLFDGLYNFAGKIRNKNIKKGNFAFANQMYLNETLEKVENMKEDTFNDIINKYIEINICHPFMEGNGRSMRIWLDLMLIKRLNKCIDWSMIDKKAYLSSMEKSVFDDKPIKELLGSALIEYTNDREVFIKGIDYSYYYEEID